MIRFEEHRPAPREKITSGTGPHEAGRLGPSSLVPELPQVKGFKALRPKASNPKPSFLNDLLEICHVFELTPSVSKWPGRRTFFAVSELRHGACLGFCNLGWCWELAVCTSGFAVSCENMYIYKYRHTHMHIYIYLYNYIDIYIYIYLLI